MILVNKFDSNGFDRMMARVKAESDLPGDGPMVEFPAGEAPPVRVRDIHGTAVAYTRGHGLIEWTDSRGKYHFDWFAAGEIRRVPSDTPLG